MELAEHDAGSRREARLGEDVVVTLGENPTTGYRWHLIDPAGALQITDDSYDASSQLAGASGTRRLTLRATTTGDVQLVLHKRRSWEQQPVDEFAVDLHILPST